MKRLVVCCDGTNNQLAGDLTNVVRIFEVAVKSDQQVVFYDPGVGTMADPLARGPISRRWSLVKGLAFGAGLRDNIFDAYRFLMREYEDGDQVYLFGFSRGAFTARVLAGILHAAGLLDAGAENLLPYVWRNYRGIRLLPTEATAQEREVADRHAREVNVLRRSFTRPCPIAFLGVWDTVGSVGMYNWNQAFPHTFENESVAIVRHAVALDERRAAFRSSVFKADASPLPRQPDRPRVMNVWFPGVHSDVGGGYRWPEQCGLAMGAFRWMVREAEKAGMMVRPDRESALLEECPPDPCADMHDSLTGGWKLMEFLPARRYDWGKKKTIWRIKANKPRTMIQSPYLHQSVLDRMAAKPDYRPVNLPAGHNFPVEV